MKTAICSGSFDPITLGHLDIIRRAAACFDKVYVCVSPNASKKNQMFTPEEKLELVKTAVADLDNVEAELYQGLLADYAVDASDPTLTKIQFAGSIWTTVKSSTGCWALLQGICTPQQRSWLIPERLIPPCCAPPPSMR